MLLDDQIPYPAPEATILVIDDAPDAQSAIADVLVGKYHVVSALEGRAGVKKAKEIKPQLILLDIIMPSMNGFDVLRQLAGDEATRHIPVVIITGRNFDATTIQMFHREPNVVAFVSKPFRPKKLRDIVTTALLKTA